MKRSFAEKLMNRPIEYRWISCPSPKRAKNISGLLVALNDGIATVRTTCAKKDYQIKLSEIKYR